MGYVDGMSLYEFVSSAPVSALDPSGLIRWTLRSSDLAQAKNALLKNELGRRLVADIERLEKLTGITVHVKEAEHSETESHAGNVTVTSHFFGLKELPVFVNPLDQIGLNPSIRSLDWYTAARGPFAEDVEIGIPLHESLFHELVHAKHKLMAEAGDFLSKLLFSPNCPKIPPGWLRDRFTNWEEMRTILEEAMYSLSQGMRPRIYHNTTPEQDNQANLMRQNGRQGPPLNEWPKFIDRAWRAYLDRLRRREQPYPAVVKENR